MSGDHNFFKGLRPRVEGEPVYTEKELAPYKNRKAYTYVERRVPEYLEDEAHKRIDKLLSEHGYDPEEF